MGSCRPLLLVGLALLLRLAEAHAEPVDTGDAKLAADVARLEAELAASPENLDLQLELAYHLGWQRKAEAARVHAQAVVDAAPQYWDAHVLLARLDAWAGQYETARERIALILAANTNNKSALLLKADVGLWSKHYDDAEEAIEALLVIEPSPDLYFRLAQIALIRMDRVGARDLAAKALELDPDHARAKALHADTKVVTFYATSQAEYFPAIAGEARKAYAQTLVLALVPRPDLGVAITYDFHRRFGTDNHRLGARTNWWANEAFLISAFFRGGRSFVLPNLSADLGFVHKPSRNLALGAKYNWDKMHWPGTLHRGTAHLSAQVTEGMLLTAEYFGGAMRHCGDSDYVQGVSFQSRYQLRRWALGLRYAFGIEVERPPLPAYLQGRVDEDFCLSDLGSEVEGSPLDLAQTRAHQPSAEASVQLTGSTILQAGYGVQLRFDDTKVHLFHLALQQAI